MDTTTEISAPTPAPVKPPRYPAHHKRRVPAAQRDFLSPPEVALVMGIDTNKVVRLIKNGRLAAVDLSEGEKGQRPRYVVRREDLDEFWRREKEAHAAKVAAQLEARDFKPIRRRRHKSAVPEYIK